MGIWRAFSLTILLVSTAVFAAAQVSWKPVTPAELQQKSPTVEPDADAEAIFWEVELDDEKKKKLFYSHYVRVKIFTERGREKFAKFDIPFSKGKTVEDVAARVIKPDGTIINVQPSDIFDRDIIRAGKILIRAKSFAIPGIEPGVIVEYRYRETVKGDSINNEKLWFQRDIPIQRMTYYVRPYKGQDFNVAWKNMAHGRFVDAGNGFYSATETNIPAMREEPYGPPDDLVRRWGLLTYSNSRFDWDELAIGYSVFFRDSIREDKQILEKAWQLTAGLPTDEEKLRKLFEFAQTGIRNVTYDPGMTDEQRSKIENKRAIDTLKRGMGHSIDIDILFAAMAKALGFEVQVMLSGDRSESSVDPRTVYDPRYVHWSGIAVFHGKTASLCNPGSPYMPFGLLDWYEEGVSTLTTGSYNNRWQRTEITRPEINLSKRLAKLKLHADGTLEGVIRVEHNGHQATSRRRDLYLRSPEEREKILLESWKQSLGSAEITAFRFIDFNDSSRPYTYMFNVKVPNYAQKTGKRLFLQPNFFKYGTSPVFSSQTRKYPIYFDFAWSEEDSIDIELPEGYEIDSLGEPNEIKEGSDLGRLTNYYTFDKENNLLKADRRFYFGTKGRLTFPVTAYEPLKNLFDLFHKADTHVISLRQKQ